MIVKKQVTIFGVELTDEELSILYKAAHILDEVCGVYDSCKGCPFRCVCGPIEPAEVVTACARILEGKEV